MTLKTWLFLAATGIAAPLRLDACDDSGIPGEFPFADASAVAAFITALKTAVAHDDRNAVADRISYPLFTSLHGKRVRLSRKSFLAHYPEIFNQKVRTSIGDGEFRSPDDYHCVFWNDQGLMFGDGEVWIGAQHDDRIRIITINN